MNNPGTNALAQKLNAALVGSAAYFGNIKRYIKRKIAVPWAQDENIRLAFIKSLLNEYIGSRGGFMKPISQIKRKVEEILKNHTQIYIEIHGRENLLAEGYCRIEDYGGDRITLVSESNSVCVRGEDLRLRHLSNERIAVEGRINSVEYL